MTLTNCICLVPLVGHRSRVDVQRLEPEGEIQIDNTRGEIQIGTIAHAKRVRVEHIVKAA